MLFKALILWYLAAHIPNMNWGCLKLACPLNSNWLMWWTQSHKSSQKPLLVVGGNYHPMVGLFNIPFIFHNEIIFHSIFHSYSIMIEYSIKSPLKSTDFIRPFSPGHGHSPAIPQGSHRRSCIAQARTFDEWWISVSFYDNWDIMEV